MSDLDRHGPVYEDPVFVLCSGRSGSTLLRFTLDAHPDLACPPETNLPALCAQLATVWSLIEGAPLSANRGDEPPVIPDAAIAGVRETLDRMVTSYLQRRGRSRYCDKSLGTARFADLLLRVYPRAQFLCLYRHPMDVIASGVEACPFGLTGYGFDPYIETSPGNAVLAIARFWIDHTALALEVEEQLGNRCLRLRYEDLVTDPELVAKRIFAFLGAAPAPGITEECFSRERERFGPGDHKIWYTSRVSADSVGRGWSIPIGMIPPPIIAAINELSAKLGYLPVESNWGTYAPPTDVRILNGGPSRNGTALDLSGPSQTAAASLPSAPWEERPHETADGLPSHSEALGNRLGERVAGATPATMARWDPHAGETFIAISVPKDSRQPSEHWQVDLRRRTVSFVSAAAQKDSDWDVIGNAEAWNQVMTGEMNFSVALRSCQIRYCGGDDDNPTIGATRLEMLSRLLGLVDW
jgi:hypothetical protein